MLLCVISFDLISGCGVPGGRSMGMPWLSPHTATLLFLEGARFPTALVLVSWPVWHTSHDRGSDSEKGEGHLKSSLFARSSACWLFTSARCRPVPISNLGALCMEGAHRGAGWEGLTGHTERTGWEQSRLWGGDLETCLLTPVDVCFSDCSLTLYRVLYWVEARFLSAAC